MRVAIILNPIAGVRNSLERTRRRAEHASDLLLAAGADPEILITAHAGHARELAAGAVERGARLVVAWGGDGTVNEVATALAFGPVPLGVIPAGSGNGLARHFDLPADPPAAIRRLLSGTDRVIDVGELNGRLFVNLAGLGFDAHVAARFASLHRSRRGFLRYALIVFQELRRYQGAGYEIVVRWRSGVNPSRVPDLVCERAPVGQRRHHRAGCRHRRRLPRRRRRERTDEGDGAPRAAAAVLGDCRSCTRCADSTRGTRARHVRAATSGPCRW